MGLWFKQLFNNKFPIIGMIHLDALPGTPFYRGNFDAIITKAIEEAKIYTNNSIDAVIIENMNDVPYVQRQCFGPETVACMTKIASIIRETVKHIPCGIQVLACGNEEALAVAKACNLNFIRAEGFIFSHVADEGFTNANAGQLLRYRRNIDADHIRILTDIKKKHSAHAITDDVSLKDTAKAAEFFRSDGIVLTGTSTGCETNVDDLKDLHNEIELPLIVGSGVTVENVSEYWNIADAAIVGSYFKQKGHWKGDLSEVKVQEFMSKLEGFRSQ
ncbi:uncharacterized protein F13E9.13, mitochondrial isoform X3 [Armigeres subalbatus]|uniref:uncharacterized protein F13E9.13, mitochondrial isoform X3 n=1 Tax=Armigeres subalbatus TaxID=124917 RepID=UPI002ED225F1